MIDRIDREIKFSTALIHSFFLSLTQMDQRPRKRAKVSTSAASEEEVNSNEWQYIDMTKQEVDLINKMYSLVGNRWHLIAGRIPGRKAEVIERFWIMRHANTANQHSTNHS